MADGKERGDAKEQGADTALTDDVFDQLERSFQEVSVGLLAVGHKNRLDLQVLLPTRCSMNSLAISLWTDLELNMRNCIVHCVNLMRARSG